MNIYQAVAVSNMLAAQKAGCKCVAFWQKFMNDPEFTAYDQKYGNYPGKPGTTDTAKFMESEFQQGGKFNDVNEIGTEADHPRSNKGGVPKGWEGTLEHMQDHPQISNAYALVNWMRDQGYSPHAKKKDK